MEDKLQAASRAALNAEKHLCADMINNIKDVKIYGIVKHRSGRIDTIDLIDYYTNFPFHWLTEIKVLLSDAVEQYQNILNENKNGKQL